MADPSEQSMLLSQFSSIVGIPPAEAQQYLVANDWSLEAAVAEYYASQEEAGDPDDDDDENDQDYEDEPETTPVAAQPARSGGRRLGEGPSDSPTAPTLQPTSSQSKKKLKPQKKFATLEDFGGAGHGHDDDDDDEKHDLFAGGEKSGLAVQNPDDLKKKILEKAMKKQRPVDKEQKAPSNHFAGAARTLGGDDTPSVEVASTEQPAAPAGRVERVLHFWNNGFSVDEGDLYRTDDPRNADILNGIRQGRAPLHIMNVLPGQEVDVEIKQHEEDYVKPKKKFLPFGGSGNRLGSPTPGGLSMPGAFTSASAAPAAAAAPSGPPVMDVNEDQPTLTLRITLGNGTRLTSRFNATHNIGDVYEFVRRADSSGRSFVMATTFPIKELDNKDAVLGEMSDFKRGGTMIQRYT